METTAAWPAERARWLNRGLRLEGVTIGYNVLEGVVAIIAGFAAGSIALTSFGFDSLIEVTSGLILWWRLRAELHAAARGPAAEVVARRLAGVLLLGLALYVVAESTRRLLERQPPRESVIGIALTALSLVVMPLLARAKLRAVSVWVRVAREKPPACAWSTASLSPGRGRFG